jgi:hypothetical protein
MRRVWATVVSVWIVLAIVAALAWTRQPARVVSPPVAMTLVVKGKHGTTHRVVVLGTTTANSTYATTRTSPPPLP